MIVACLCRQSLARVLCVVGLKNPCSFDNGGCEDKCHTDAHGKIMCGCEAPLQLQPDNHTCGRKSINLLPSNIIQKNSYFHN